jgi:hypothetical protein
VTLGSFAELSSSPLPLFTPFVLAGLVASSFSGSPPLDEDFVRLFFLSDDFAAEESLSVSSEDGFFTCRFSFLSPSAGSRSSVLGSFFSADLSEEILPPEASFVDLLLFIAGFSDLSDFPSSGVVSVSGDLVLRGFKGARSNFEMAAALSDFLAAVSSKDFLESMEGEILPERNDLLD